MKINSNANLITNDKKITLPEFKTINVKDFNKDSLLKFRTEFEELESLNQNIIPIYIDSYGGYVAACLGMIEIIKNSDKIVATIGIGDVASCGAMLLTAGTENYRYAAKYAEIMFHEISFGTWGKVETVEKHVKQARYSQDLLYKILDENCGKKDGYFKKFLQAGRNNEIYVTAKKAKKMNIINHIGLPKFEQKIKTEIIINKGI